MRILYVENHALFAENVVSQFLSAHSVAVVPGLCAARQALEAEKFDLLLIDYDLDDGKGDELLKELHTSGKVMLAIAVSSHDEGNAALLKAGAVAVCSKMHFNRIRSEGQRWRLRPKSSFWSSSLRGNRLHESFSHAQESWWNHRLDS